MEFKGTKGKWEITRIGKPDYHNRNCGCHTIGYSMVDVWFSDRHVVKTGEEALYNATLISKAPEMLEMLQSLLEQSKKGWRFEFPEEAVEQLIKEATEI